VTPPETEVVVTAAEYDALNEWIGQLEGVLTELRGGFDDYYFSGDQSRLLNGESLIRGLIPPLGYPV
jgi:hypothetical protein